VSFYPIAPYYDLLKIILAAPIASAVNNYTGSTTCMVGRFYSFRAGEAWKVIKKRYNVDSTVAGYTLYIKIFISGENKKW